MKNNFYLAGKIIPVVLVLAGPSAMAAGKGIARKNAGPGKSTGKVVAQKVDAGAIAGKGFVKDAKSGQVVAMVPEDAAMEQNFETNSSVVVNGFPLLECVVQGMREKPDTFLVLNGYADGRGGKAHNLKLSQARADSLKEFMRQHGAPVDRLKAVGLGPLPVGSPEHNWGSRKVRIVAHTGGFNGPVIPHVPIGDCPQLGFYRDPAPKVVTVIPAPDVQVAALPQVPPVDVDYDRIQKGVDESVARILAQRLPAAPAQVIVVPAATVQRDYRVTVFGGHSNDRVDSYTAGLNVDFISPVGPAKDVPAGQARPLIGEDRRDLIQYGAQLEASSYRRKGELYGIYTLRTAFGLDLSAIGTYGWASGVPYLCTPPPVRTIMRGGIRVGVDHDRWNLGAMYFTPISQQSSAADISTPTPTEPANP